MLERNETDFLLDDLADLTPADKKGKKDKCCVCINVFTRCDKKQPWKKDEKFCGDKKHKDDDCCVCINIFTECEE